MFIISHCEFFRFIDVPIESCGKATPLRVALQASAPDILLILLRYGANPSPSDGGTSPVLALMDKLLEYEDTGSYPYQLVSCLKLLLLAIPFIELPYKVGMQFETEHFPPIYLPFPRFASHYCSKRDVKCSWESIRRYSSRRWLLRAEHSAFQS